MQTPLFLLKLRNKICYWRSRVHYWRRDRLEEELKLTLTKLHESDWRRKLYANSPMLMEYEAMERKKLQERYLHIAHRLRADRNGRPYASV